jgi:hypothetical protein
MAKSGKWDNELCAEHDGSIASFNRLDLQLADIAEYKKIFIRESRNLKKFGTISALSLGGAISIGPCAFLAAPAIGGVVGAAMGLSGVAATSAGLAAIGGGALAAGGFGMAGGAAILGATGAALGGTLGGVISNSYFGDISGFEIEKVKGGANPAVLFIDGFLTQKKTIPDDWKQQLEILYPDKAWYYLRWESKRLFDIGTTIGAHVGKATIGAVAAGWAKSAAKAGIKRAGPLGVALTALGLANNPWTVASVRAAQTGVLLSDIISRTQRDYILCGHSLGARVIYYTLISLSTKEKKWIKHVHLLGGAVGNKKKNWEQATNAVDGVIVNYYSDKDMVLSTLYKVGMLFSSVPIGKNVIDVEGIVETVKTLVKPKVFSKAI